MNESQHDTKPNTREPPPPHEEVLRILDVARRTTRMWDAVTKYDLGTREDVIKSIARYEPWARSLIIGRIVRDHFDNYREGYEHLKGRVEAYLPSTQGDESEFLSSVAKTN